METLKEAGFFFTLFIEGRWFLHIGEPWSVLLDIKSYPFKSVFIVLPGFRPSYFLLLVRIITGIVGAHWCHFLVVWGFLKLLSASYFEIILQCMFLLAMHSLQSAWYCSIEL